METVASSVMIPVVRSTAWSPSPRRKESFRLSPPIRPFLVMNSILAKLCQQSM